MKIKDLVIIVYFSIFIIFDCIAENIEFESSNIDIKNNGNLIIAYDSEIKLKEKQIYVKAKKSTYDKILNVITFEKDVYLNDELKNTIIEGRKLIYDRNKDLISSEGKTKINLNGKYHINSKDIFYDRILDKIYGNDQTLIDDYEKNYYQLEDGFIFDILNEIIKSKKSIITDNNNNKYNFENLLINLKTNEIAGREIKVEFLDSSFGNEKNDPILKGRSGYSNDEELKVYKAVFSTCNIENKNCRGWELKAEEFNHDKERKLFEYRDSWLKIFDYKVFYLPYFNHPDPSVKRKSGFLTPSYSASKSLGTSLNFPYFKILGDDKDLTFNPKYYADKSFLLQNEYRQVFKSSNLLSDFSFMVGEEGTKGHFFYNQIGRLNNNLNFKINLQNVEGDNYLKKHDLKENSILIKDDNLLLTNLDLNWSFEDSNLSTSFKIFEDLSRNRSDRYQYVFPDYNFSKNIEIPNDYNGKFNFNTYGYNKNYNTNINESVLTNDFLFSSNQFINMNGIVSNYNLLLKNTNSYSNNSSAFKENSNYDLYGTFKYDVSLPLQKIMDKYKHFLTPKISFRYSPNDNSDISSKNILLNYNNVFGLNRIGTSHEVEGGESLSAGLEFKRENIEGLNVIDFKIANVLKLQENNQLPSKSKLNKTRSDIFGDLNYNFNENLKIGYSFSYDRDLDFSNLEQINFEYGLNNFYTNFSYYTEDNDMENKENIKNFSRYNLNNENKFSFEINKDLKDDFTQYYNLIYTYETDCISVNFNYNKTFYRDGNLEPNRSLSFLIKIIPFTELGVPNVNLIGN